MGVEEVGRVPVGMARGLGDPQNPHPALQGPCTHGPWQAPGCRPDWAAGALAGLVLGSPVPTIILVRLVLTCTRAAGQGHTPGHQPTAHPSRPRFSGAALAPQLIFREWQGLAWNLPCGSSQKPLVMCLREVRGAKWRGRQERSGRGPRSYSQTPWAAWDLIPCHVAGPSGLGDSCPGAWSAPRNP